MNHSLDSSKNRPVVWYMAAGYKIPAGIEAHVLHYATELRNHGFETRVVVFSPLPKETHRFLDLLRNRNIPITSIVSDAKRRILFNAGLLFVPWFLYLLLVKKRLPDCSTFLPWLTIRESVKQLGRMIRKEDPDIIHIFGRLWTDAWPYLPAERTIFHEMMTGTVDEYWDADELVGFRSFAESIARYFAPGTGVAENVHREFGIKRDIDVIYTMCPDEATERPEVSGQPSSLSASPSHGESEGREKEERPEVSGQKSEVSDHLEGQGDTALTTNNEQRATTLRFGILGRLVEQKGIKYLLEALVLFKQKYGDVDFTFAGYGDHEDMIKTYIGEHDFQNVRIVRVNNVVDVLKDIDVFVHPSLDDAMPVSLAEALMCGVPCIASNVGGIPDLIRDGQEGFLIEPRNIEEILGKMSCFNEMSESGYTEFRDRARARYIEKCRPVAVGERVAQLYRDVINHCV